ncbi:MAG: DUF4465 domain-containing protein [Pirellulales bacterium]|nr:DUF4465 domain-containing protein [Pirellulales bacterium]
MKRWLPSLLFAMCLLTASGMSARGETITFEDLPLASNSYWNGPDPAGVVVDGPYGPEIHGTFQSGGASFVNRYDETFASWSGFAYSNTTDTTTPGFENQFSAITGTGHGPGADNYAVAFGYMDLVANSIQPAPFDPHNVEHLMSLPYFELPLGALIEGLRITNTTYAVLSMQFGDSFSKKFGGVSGNDADFFKLTAYGTDELDQPLGTSVDFYLADFRFANNALDYIVTDWEFMDLSSLSGARRVHFNLSSSDVGTYGMNTPAYFAIDDVQFAAVPEPSSLVIALGGSLGVALLLRRRRAS